MSLPDELRRAPREGATMLTAYEGETSGHMRGVIEIGFVLYIIVGEMLYVYLIA